MQKYFGGTYGYGFNKKIEDIYLEKMKEMINETLDIFLHDEKVWQKKKNAIATDISNCFNHLIIPDDILKKILPQSNRYKQFQDIQVEIIEALEKFLSNEIKLATEEQTKYTKELNDDIVLLKENFKEIAAPSNYINKTNNPLFVSNTYLEECLNFLREIVKKNLSNSFPLEQYKKLIKILIEQKILTDDGVQKVNIDLKKREQLLEKIYTIYNKIIRLKYVLSFHINPEIIFALGFVDNKLFSEAETLHRIVLHRTQLFKDMIVELPSNLKRYCSLTDLQPKTNTIPDSNKQLLSKYEDIFIYQRVSDLDNIYFSQNPKDGLYLYNSDTFKSHWIMLRKVYKETRLLFPDIIPKKYTKTDIYINLIGNTNGEIAKLFAMSEAKFSRLKNNAQKITPQWALFLEKFLDFDSKFLRGTTTIPNLSFLGDECLIPIVSFSRRMKPGILYAFKEYLTDLQNELNRQNLNSDFSYLIQHLNLLINNINKLDEEHFKAIDLLLGFGLKNKKVIKK